MDNTAKTNPKTYYAIFISLFFLLTCMFISGCETFDVDKRLQVHFIDVGQGDCTLVISPSGKSMLIDAGDNSQGDKVISYLKQKGVNKIDILIGTHPDADHIGGLDDVIEAFDIGEFYMPRKSHTTKTFESVLISAKSKGISIKEGYAGKVLQFDHQIDLEILSPIKSKLYSDDNNLYSIVLKLDYLSSSFLFMGDAEYQNENDILTSKKNLKSDILKLGHHGSDSSTSESFLKAVSPSAAVVSAGYKNKYSHPHKEVLSLLESSEIPIYRTDEQGDIIFKSDGQTITVNNKPGTYTYRKVK